MPPSPSSRPKIAVIGAGMTGLSCARVLAQNGFAPAIFEKSRGLGGRIATRRVSEDMAFDHGAQYATARDNRFQDVIETASTQNACATWSPEIQDKPNNQDWLVGTPAMNALLKPLAKGLVLNHLSRVMAVERNEAGWQVQSSLSPQQEAFDIVVSTVPAPQAQALFKADAVIANSLSTVTMAPCWTLMIAFSSRFEPGFDVWRGADQDLDWIGRNSSKPGRSPSPDCWVVHASPAWSTDHLELNPEDIATKMMAAITSTLPAPLPQIEYAVAHRWRYARTTTALGTPYLCSDDQTLFVGGDWCLGARIECAFESGTAMGHAVIDAQGAS